MVGLGYGTGVVVHDQSDAVGDADGIEIDGGQCGVRDGHVCRLGREGGRVALATFGESGG